MPDPIVAESKPFWQSKTFWVNAITIIWGVLPKSWGLTPEGLTPEVLAIILGIVNVVLRAITKSEVTVS